MDPLDLVRLTPLMRRTRGSRALKIGLIDGPVSVDHPQLAGATIRKLSGGTAACANSSSTACLHGTFIAGILSAKRGSGAPAICPDCILQVRPIFSEFQNAKDQTPSASPAELAVAIRECIAAGSRVINLSLGLGRPSIRSERELDSALFEAMRRGVIVVAAAGNQGTVGSSAITRHPWVIPVTACGLNGQPSTGSNLANSIGRLGLMAPGEKITSLATEGQPIKFGGTSVAVPFVTGAVALLWSEFPRAHASEIRNAIIHPGRRRRSVAPPLLDAEAAHEYLRKMNVRSLAA